MSAKSWPAWVTWVLGALIVVVIVAIVIGCFCRDEAGDELAIDLTPDVTVFAPDDETVCYFAVDQVSTAMNMVQWEQVSHEFPAGSVFDEVLGLIQLPPKAGREGELQVARLMAQWEDHVVRRGGTQRTDATAPSQTLPSDDVSVPNDSIPEDPIVEDEPIDPDIVLIRETSALNYIIPWAQTGKPGWGPYDAAEPVSDADLKDLRQGRNVAVFDTGVMPSHGPADSYLVPMTEKVDNQTLQTMSPNWPKSIPQYAFHGEFIASVIGPGPDIQMYTPYKPEVGHPDLAELRNEIILAVSDNGPAPAHDMFGELTAWMADEHPERRVDPLRDRSVINMSFAFEPCFDDTGPLEGLFELLEEDGHTVVAAAGNFPVNPPVGDPVIPRDTKMFPAAFGTVIGVAATDDQGVLASFSRCGPWVNAAGEGVDVVGAFAPVPATDKYTVDDNSDKAPGGPHNFSSEHASWSGTSFATPQVVRAIAMEKVDPQALLNNTDEASCTDVPQSMFVPKS